MVLGNTTLSKNLKEIPGYIFYNCSSLSEVEIPDSVKKIGTSILYGCENLEKVTIKSPELTNQSAHQPSAVLPTMSNLMSKQTQSKICLLTHVVYSADNMTFGRKRSQAVVNRELHTSAGGYIYKVLSDPTDTANGTVGVVGDGYSGCLRSNIGNG